MLRQQDVRNNALNTLKILVALLVACFHTLVHLKVPVSEGVAWVFGDLFKGVPIFFVLSGFLIWHSLESTCSREGNFVTYAKKRAIRIFPELWVGVAVEIIVLLIVFKETINWLLLALFTIGQATFFQFWTPDFLRSYGCGVPNGSLWTMCTTIQFYIIAWFLHKWLKGKNCCWWIGTLVATVLLKAVSPTIIRALPTIAGKLYGQTILPYLWLFVFGAFLARYHERAIPFLKRTWWLLLAASVAVAITKWDMEAEKYGLLTCWLQVSGLIGLAYTVPSLNITFDISYGVFIYHMLVVNLMIEWGFVGNVSHLIVTLVISILLACLSTLLGRYMTKALNNKLLRR